MLYLDIPDVGSSLPKVTLLCWLPASGLRFERFTYIRPRAVPGYVSQLCALETYLFLNPPLEFLS